MNAFDYLRADLEGASPDEIADATALLVRLLEPSVVRVPDPLPIVEEYTPDSPVLQVVEVNGLRCWADSLRLADVSHYTVAVFVSLFGPRNAVRAAWAKLVEVSGRRHKPSIKIGERHVSLAADTRYVTVSTPISRGMLHTLIVHPSGTHQCSPFAQGFLQIGPDPETRYFQRLNRMCVVPFRPSWKGALWRLGQSAGLIERLQGHGLPGYRVITSDAWAAVVQTALVDGVLS